jgi:hypothetical protein
MTLDEIIDFFKGVEGGKEGQLVGYHLHYGINLATKHSNWSDHELMTFSSFLQKLKDHPKPE